MPISHAFVFLPCLPRPQSPRTPLHPRNLQYRLSCIPFFLAQLFRLLIFFCLFFFDARGVAFCILFILRVARASRRHHRLTDNFNQHQRHRADSRLWTLRPHVPLAAMPLSCGICHALFAARVIGAALKLRPLFRFKADSFLWVLTKVVAVCPPMGG